MRFLRSFWLLALCVLGGYVLDDYALAAPLAASPTALPALTPLRSAQLPFALSVPRDWLGVDLKDGMGGVTLQSAKRAPYATMRLLYLPKQGRLNLASEFNDFEASLRGAGSLKRLSEQPASYGGVRGVTRTYALNGKPGPLNMQVWFGAGARNFYSFMLTSPPTRFAADQALFKQVLSTIQF